jgi:hypothetical protein
MLLPLPRPRGRGFHRQHNPRHGLLPQDELLTEYLCTAVNGVRVLPSLSTCGSRDRGVHPQGLLPSHNHPNYFS